jgi:hypothetical protein
MILDKDVVIVGRGNNAGLASLALKMAAKAMLKICVEKTSFPGQSLILDNKGVPFKQEGAGETITIRRYNKFKTGGQDGRGQRKDGAANK